MRGDRLTQIRASPHPSPLSEREGAGTTVSAAPPGLFFFSLNFFQQENLQRRHVAGD